MSLVDFHSLFDDGHLVAYVSRTGELGTIVRAGHEDPIGTVRGARVEVFSRKHEALLTTLGNAAEDVDVFLFKCGIEGLEVREGQHTPGSTHRRF